jgi:hypothetical protein
MANAKSTMSKTPGIVSAVQGEHGENISGMPSGNEQMTPVERLAIHSPSAAKFVKRQEDLARADRNNAIAHEQLISELRNDVGDAHAVLRSIEKHPGSTVEAIAKAQGPVTLAEKALAEANANPPKNKSVAHYVNTFLNSREYIGFKWCHKVVPEPANPDKLGDAELLEWLREAKANCETRMRIAKRAPVAEDLIRTECYRAVDELVGEYGKTDVRKAARMSETASGLLHQGTVEWPRLDSIIGGTPDEPRIYKPIDAAAILAEFFGDQLKELLFEKAIASFDPATVLDINERREIVERETKQIDLILRQAEFVAQRLDKTGVHFNRLSTLPEILLQIEKVV